MTIKTAFVTGATGYAGPTVIAALREAGIACAVLVRQPPAVKGCRTITGDTSAFEKATGFQPRETLEEIVEAFVRMERAQQPA